MSGIDAAGLTIIIETSCETLANPVGSSGAWLASMAETGHHDIRIYFSDATEAIYKPRPNRDSNEPCRTVVLLDALP